MARGWNIPRTKIGSWAWELVEGCSASLDRRRMQGQAYENLFLTGDESGDPQTFPAVLDYIDDKASYLYSPVDLKFQITPYGQAGPRERAMGRAAAAELYRRMRESNVDMAIDDCNLWSLIKGKTFLALYWSKNGFEPHVVEPEVMGVLRDDLPTLDRQDAFFHQVWMTPLRFADFVRGHPKEKQILRSARSKKSTTPIIGPGNAALRQILVGAPYGAPYQPAGQGQGSTANQRNQVFWLTAPEAMLTAKVQAELICVYNLWAWDRQNDDWVTISLVGPDCVIYGEYRQTNMFAEYPNPKDLQQNIVPASDDSNPLRGHHPYIEFCPNRLPKYFWGDPEIRRVSLAQKAINRRIDGINQMQRLEERPPRVFHGMPTVTQNVYTRLNKPGGYLSDSQPGGKVDTLKPDIPADTWSSLHEYEEIMHKIGGRTATLRGEGEQGVRAQAHAETLVRTGSPRIKDGAITQERAVDAVGGLALDILKARCVDPFAYWVKDADAGPFKDKTLDPMVWEPPVPGMVGIEMFFHHLDDRYKVSVDGHSSSPAFSKEAKQDAAALAARGAMSPEELVRAFHPDNEQEIIDDIERRDYAKQQLLKQAEHNPELLKVLEGGKRHH